MKTACRECLERLKVPVSRVVDALTDLPADDMEKHKQFLESHVKVLYQSDNHSELFGTLSFNVNYLSYQLVDCITDEFKLEVKYDMEIYKKGSERRHQ